jgi:deoxyribodipyrimidine photo-lyase
LEIKHEQQFYDCEIGKDYPAPIVNIEETRRYASDIVWSFRKDRSERGGKKILKKHVSNPNRKTRKNKILMTIFLKANWENIIMANYD